MREPLSELIEEALLAHQQGNLEKAKQVYEQVLAESNIPEIRNNLANILLQQPDYQSAIFHLQQALLLVPDYQDALYNLALAFLQSNEMTKAHEQLNLLLQSHPDHKKALQLLAKIHFEKKEYQLAREYFHRLLTLDTQDHLTLFNLGLCYLLLKNLETAFHYFQQAHQLSPHEKDYLYQLALTANRLNYAHNAIEYYEKILAHDDNDIIALHNLSILYKNLNKTDKALVYLKKLLSINGEDMVAQFLYDSLSGQALPEKAPAEFVENLFNTYADSYDQHMQQVLNYQLPQKVGLLLRKLAKPASQWVIFDLGCGTGLMGSFLKPYASQLVGVDLADQMLAIAREKNVYTKLIHADIANILKLYRSKIDLITALEVFNYFGELSSIFNLVNQAMRPGGYFIFSIEETRQHNFSLQSTSRYNHHQRYIKQLAKMAGFKIVKNKKVLLRKQEDTNVLGRLYCLRKR